MLKVVWTPKHSQIFRKFDSGFMAQLLVCHVFVCVWQTKPFAELICITAWVGLQFGANEIYFPTQSVGWQVIPE